MIPRKRIDITPVQLLRGLVGCFAFGNAAHWATHWAAHIERTWDSRNNLACLSVRSGFDALLTVLNMPRGSEVLMSAVNIADMARIVEAHGLIAVPVDLDMQTLAVATEALQRAYSPQARLMLLAHLFGTRMPMRAIAEFCNKNNMLLVEDCAQSYTGDAWRGDPASDVTLFSFGPVKTATALGGAVLGFRDAALCERVRTCMESWPMQTRFAYARRLLKYLLLTPFAQRKVFGALVAVCRWLGVDRERLVSGAVRGFAGGEFLNRIRRRPSAPLLQMLRARLNEGVSRTGMVRRARAKQLSALLPCVGAQAAIHTHWLFPITYARRELLIAHLARHGFDAALKASSIGVLEAPPGRAPATQALETFASLAYLPAHEGMSEADIERLAKSVATL